MAIALLSVRAPFPTLSLFYTTRDLLPFSFEATAVVQFDLAPARTVRMAEAAAAVLAAATREAKRAYLLTVMHSCCCCSR